jgi:hypothetical protein
MAYLEDDFIDDQLDSFDLADEDLDLVFRVTDDGELWDDLDEEGYELDDDDWDDDYLDDDEDWDDDDDDDDDDDVDALLNDDSLFDRIEEVYKEFREMGL